MSFARKIVGAFQFVRSRLAEQKGEYAKALDLLDRAIERTRPTASMMARRALLLTLNGRTPEAKVIYDDLGAANPSDNPNREYVRIGCQSYSAYLDDDLARSNRLYAELQLIPCDQRLRSSLPFWPMARGRADVILSRLDVQGADPLGFYTEPSGLYIVEAYDAWLDREPPKALKALAKAEGLAALSPQQKAFKAALLTHAGDNEGADQIFGGVLADLPAVPTEELAYLRFYCEYHRPGHSPNRDAALMAARELAPKAAIARLLPLPDAVNTEAIQQHFLDSRGGFPIQRVQYILRLGEDIRGR